MGLRRVRLIGAAALVAAAVVAAGLLAVRWAVAARLGVAAPPADARPIDSYFSVPE